MQAQESRGARREDNNCQPETSHPATATKRQARSDNNAEQRRDSSRNHPATPSPDPAPAKNEDTRTRGKNENTRQKREHEEEARRSDTISADKRRADKQRADKQRQEENGAAFTLKRTRENEDEARKRENW